MLVTREPHRRDIPHEEGAWIEICKLSWVQLKKARKAATLDNAEMAKAFGAELIKALQGDDAEKKVRTLNKALQYDETQFDTELLLAEGVVGWSYEDELGPETIKQLDEETAAWAKQEIIDLTKPPSEEELKNSSGSSTEP